MVHNSDVPNSKTWRISSEAKCEHVWEKCGMMQASQKLCRRCLGAHQPLKIENFPSLGQKILDGPWTAVNEYFSRKDSPLELSRNVQHSSLSVSQIFRNCVLKYDDSCWQACGSIEKSPVTKDQKWITWRKKKKVFFRKRNLHHGWTEFGYKCAGKQKSSNACITRSLSVKWSTLNRLPVSLKRQLQRQQAAVGLNPFTSIEIISRPLIASDAFTETSKTRIN